MSNLTSESDQNLWRASHQTGNVYPALDQKIDVDLLIIGGGFTGCSAALEAAKSGARVAVLEAQTIGHGGSGRNVGLVNAGLWLPPKEIIKKLGKTAGDKLIQTLGAAPNDVFSLIDREGISCSAIRNGTLHLAHAPSGLKDLEARFRQGNQYGAPLQLLDANETKARTGSNAFHGALFDPRAGTIQPLAYCRGLAQAAAKAGAQIFDQTKVSDLSYENGIWQASANGHVVSAKYVLLATNAYLNGLNGVSQSEFVPVAYSQFATKPLTDAQRQHILPGGEGCWDTALVMTSIRLNEEGRLIIGGIGNEAGPGSAIHAAWARRKLASYYPELANLEFEHQWHGRIAMTSDHIPKVVRLGPNAVSIFGFSGRGIGPGTVFGKSAARALLFDEYDALPIAISDTYKERLRSLRASYFEMGSILTHALPVTRTGPVT